MGGGAFAQAYAEGEPTLSTSRIGIEDYHRLKFIYLQKLQDLFPDAKVASLIEAPEKTDYGDMDIFIALDRKVDLIATAKKVGAVGIVYERGLCCNLAVRKDGTPSDRATVQYKPRLTHQTHLPKPSETTITEQYAQIDVEIISSQYFEWHSFYSAYGDMSSMIGHIVSPLGFRFNDHGLWLRLDDEMALAKKHGSKGSNKEGLVLLSAEVKQAMEFLGLSFVEYGRNFETLQKLYGWLAQCRLISAEVVKARRHKADRKEKRVVFTKFFDEYLPAHMEMKDGQDESQQEEAIEKLRAKNLHEALSFFSKHEQYKYQQDILIQSAKENIAVEALRPLINEHCGGSLTGAKAVFRVFRRWLKIDGEGEIRIAESSHSDTDSQLHKLASTDSATLRNPERVRKWMEDNWERILEIKRGGNNRNGE